jgi:hypothetical protein
MLVPAARAGQVRHLSRGPAVGACEPVGTAPQARRCCEPADGSTCHPAGPPTGGWVQEPRSHGVERRNEYARNVTVFQPVSSSFGAGVLGARQTSCCRAPIPSRVLPPQSDLQRAPHTPIPAWTQFLSGCPNARRGSLTPRKRRLQHTPAFRAAPGPGLRSL